jgi:hypothetical protein
MMNVVMLFSYADPIDQIPANQNAPPHKTSALNGVSKERNKPT